MLGLFLGMLVGSFALVISLGLAMLGEDGYEEDILSVDADKGWANMSREEIFIVNGCRVIIKYADEENPEALNEMRALLEKQRMIPKKTSKFDDDK